MKCPKCYTENPSDSKYCKVCATLLPSSEEISASPTKTLEIPKEELTTGSTFAGRYQIIEELGKGGMGKVYKVHDIEIKEMVALKLLKPEIALDEKTIERFRDEMRLARKIVHKNVGRMYDLGKEKGAYYITMEYVSGQDLKGLIRQSRQLTVGTAISIAKQVCEGLAEAHMLGIVHRDLNPSNIMIDKEGNARIMDFGIARSLKAKGITGAGVMIGTPEYMSPEQVEGKDVDQRSDIYSLGVILYEMVTGRVPFEGETALSVAMKHKSEKPPRPEELNPQIPGELSQMILRCMEKDKEKRYQAVENILSELSAIQQEMPTTETITFRRKPQASKEITVTFGLKKAVLPVVAFVALSIVAFTLWKVLSREKDIPVVSDKPSLAIMYLKNNTGDENLNHWRSALADLLITDISQSKYIRVLSGEMMFDILNQLDQLEATTYSSAVLREVAERGRVDRILAGNYTKAEDTFRINITLQDAHTGELIGSESVEGVGEKSFYAMVDELTRRIKADFKLSEQEIADDIDDEIEKITTSSPEAYKYYSEGRRLHLQAEYWPSISSMQKAIEIDPGFAMAYRSVAMSYSNMGMRPAKRTAIEKAFELSGRVSERERYIIQADYYRTSERTFDKALESYQKLLELYPDDHIGNTNLGILYFGIEDWDNAIKQYEINIRNNPEGLFGYWNLAEAYEAMGLYDRAREILGQYLERNPEHVGIQRKIVEYYLYQEKYDLALAKLEDVLAQDLDPETRFGVGLFRGIIYLLQGNMIQAEKEFQNLPEGSGIQNARMSLLYLLQGKFQAAIAQLQEIPGLYLSLADAYLKGGNPEAALKEYEKEWRDAVKEESLSWQIHTLHSNGLAYLQMKNFDEVFRIADEIQDLVQIVMRKKNIRYYHHLIGMIELEKGEYSRAVLSLKKAVDKLYAPESNFPQIQALFTSTLAQAYYKAGNLNDAQEEYEKVASLALGRLQDGDIYARSLYMLGKIFQERGQTGKAVEYYEKFLDLWKDADPGIPEVEDASKRLAGLKD